MSKYNTMEFNTLEAGCHWLFHHTNPRLHPTTLKRIISIKFYDGSSERGIIYYADN